MKKFFNFILLMAVLVTFLTGCNSETPDNSNYLRIHIRADNNDTDSQSVKYVIKEKLTTYLTPILSQCDTKEKAFNAVNCELKIIEQICNQTLLEKGFNYTSKARLDNEFFPLRSYNEYVFDSGNYDSLIIELGEGKGDNWWCMVYPPLCFTGGEITDGKEITYKSKILEIIEQFKQKYFS